MKVVTEDDTLKAAEYRIATHIKDAIWVGLKHAEEKTKALNDLKVKTIEYIAVLRENTFFDFKKEMETGISAKSVRLEGAIEGIDSCIKIINECELRGLKWM